MENTGKSKSVLKYRLIGISSFFILLIIIGFISLRQPDFTWKMEAEDALTYALKGDYEITPEEVHRIIESDNPEYLIVDLRSPYEYVKGHLKNAVNIPYESLLEKDNLGFFENRDSKIIILYGKDQLQANGPLMLLKQIGFDNLKVLLGGYDYYSSNNPEGKAVEHPAYLVKEPQYDFAKVVAETAGSETIKPDMEQPESIIPVRKKKKSLVEGGC